MKPPKPLKRSTNPIPKTSAKKRAENFRRRVIKDAVHNRDGSWCKRCYCLGFELDLHELVGRGRGGKAEIDNCVLLCRKCHRLVTDHNCDDWRKWVHVKKESV